MKSIVLVLALSATIAFSAARTDVQAQEAEASAQSATRLVGRWVLQVDRLPMPPETRPKAVTLEFAQVADGRWRSRVDITGPDGTPMASESTLALDGTSGRATGSYAVDTVAAKVPAPDVLVMQFVYQGIPRSTRVYTVNADASELTETEGYARPDGTPVLRTAVFTREAASRTGQ